MEPQYTEAPAVRKAREFGLGCEYWHHYLKVNGWSFQPNEKGIRKLARELDLTPKHVRHCIHVFLSA